MNGNGKAYLAEFIGTFTLVFIGCASVWATTNPGYAAGPIVPAFGHGLAIVFAAYALGHISGAHINPAVTLSCALYGAISWPKAVGYWIVQILGGIVAALVLSFIIPNQAANFGAFSYGTNTTFAGAVLMEAILTFFLCTAVLQGAVAGKAGHFAGLAIGLTLTLSILGGGAITGASLNPARTLGPAIVAAIGGASISQVPAYLIGTLLGGAIAALVSRYALNVPAPVTNAELPRTNQSSAVRMETPRSKANRR